MSIFGIPAGVASPLINGAISLLTGDAASFLSALFGAPQWGIYLDGVPVVLADNCVSVDYRRAWQISDYPVERGSFESYDKVETPFDVSVRMSAGGSEINRQAFLASIDAIAGTLQLFDVVTPEAVYASCTINRVGLRRSAESGVSLITVDLVLTEVRETATMTAATQDPSSATQKNSGPTQAVEPTAAQTAPTQRAGPNVEAGAVSPSNVA